MKTSEAKRRNAMDKDGLIIVNKFFQLNMPARIPLLDKIASLIKGGIEKALFLNRLNGVYHHVAEQTDPKEFVDKTLDALNISYDFRDDELCHRYMSSVENNKYKC